MEGQPERGIQEIDSMVDKILDSLVSARAKGVVTKGVDYTLLVVLLVIQYMRCGPDWNVILSTPPDIDIKNGTLVETNVDTGNIYSCDQNSKSLISSP